MANILSEVGSSVSAFSWASMGTILTIFIILLVIFVFFAVVLLFIWWKSYHIKVHIYEPYGQVPLSDKDVEKLRQTTASDKVELLKKSNIKFDMIKKQLTHGKHAVIKGTPYFCLFRPMLKKIESIPMDMMFNDGVHLLRLSKEVFMPIPKPETIIKIGGTISLSVADNNKWILWNNMMADRVNNKFQDVDAQKKAILYFVIGIAAMVIVGGLVMWLIYASVNKGIKAGDKLSEILDRWAVSSGISPE